MEDNVEEAPQGDSPAVDSEIAVKLANLDKVEGPANKIVAGSPRDQERLEDLKEEVRTAIGEGRDSEAQRKLEEAKADTVKGGSSEDVDALRNAA